MNFAVFSRYYRLSTQGKVPELLCGFEKVNHMGVVPRVNENDEITLICIECSYVKKPGLKLYNQLRDMLIRIDGSDDEWNKTETLT